MEMQVHSDAVQDSLSRFTSVLLAIKFSVLTEELINQLSGSGTGDCSEIHAVVIGSPVGSDYYSCISSDDNESFRSANDSIQSTNDSYTEVYFPWIVVIINFLLELASVILDWYSSPLHPKYALGGMVISFALIVICIIEIAYKAQKENVILKKRGMICWFYHPPPSNKRFGSFKSILGLVFAILQSISATIMYAYYSHHHDNPIKISFLPVVFSFFLLCSKFCKEQDKRD